MCIKENQEVEEEKKKERKKRKKKFSEPNCPKCSVVECAVAVEYNPSCKLMKVKIAQQMKGLASVEVAKVDVDQKLVSYVWMIK